MNGFVAGYLPLFDLYLLHLGMAFSQYIVLRAGVFSLASAAFAGIGAYTAGILAVSAGLHPVLGLGAGLLAGMLAGLVLSIPLARLRGVYQAIATVAFIQIVLSLNIYSDSLTGGAMGLNGIPKTVGTGTLLLAALGTIYLIWSLERGRVGRAFSAIRQDEAVAASLGVSITWYQALAFALSGALAGLFGGLEAYHSYALDPNQFGFHLLITLLSYVILGGRNSVWGPIIGTAILILLPEIARPLAENRMIMHGIILIVVINYLPKGIVDTWIDWIKARRLGTAGSGQDKGGAAS
ncbi:branched-chain amino acid ABC transporter permease [Sulfitobacter mediterraneus]|jgi:branched-chain amino acid transport system permease protein|uniref:branched-chain amino acid ABC transporter permease n=1 Tax=Sulfitobacter TaxID=60136 RepID=UPI001934670F|nr:MULTISPECIES: branched-chain amino acid ABC transporter permease [Sulfitobacter]MBM1633033.1 branched-chain amino acid ABC transporter permease [Sulfitobacter mediterraneus]MBM1640833.1 branched-chain amino acid ABC transporter permease [Sulfitobacter mediterraneus]MBM1644898.1 branched-chain amino acid ABC transporter permease [Sulfitobacter mediterraneus]MBM1648953.1 branched-chain amino acid ABC transporter permease [Sulfitobacter mediterraneus]MBM1652974.1 branched-chain amino acid ABC 